MLPAKPTILPPLRLALVFLVLAVGTWWLRAPSFGFKCWNVDEAIHASIARTLIDGGVLYRDAVDQRTPLTYGVMAAILAIAGETNLHAVHATVAMIVALTAWLLFLVARRLAGTAAAWWAGGLYAILATGMFYQGDANAYVTEWFVAAFTSGAAWLFWAAPRAPETWRLTGVGLLFGLAWLSKQPGALDLLAPLLALHYLATRESPPAWRRLLRQSSCLLLGFLAVVGVVVAYYALRGALADFVFYTWTYNLVYYGPEVSWADRLASAWTPFGLLGAFSPLLFAAAAAAAGSILRHLVQRTPSAEEHGANPARIYIVGWSLTSLIGVASGGRGFDHYSIQFLPPLCLGTAWYLGQLTVAVGPGPTRARLFMRGLVLVLLLGLAGTLVAGAWEARRRTLPVDPSRRVAAFIAASSAPDERIFVWGYHPDIYLLANRRPASRFVYASFVTGLIPWTNVAPERDTDYAIVPGAMETLLDDLETHRPVFFVDCSPGPNRAWNKYPLEKFPRLAQFVHERYVTIESGQFVPQGFRLFVLKDAYRLAPPTIPPLPGPGGHDRKVGVTIFAPHYASGSARSLSVNVSAHDSAGLMQRLELLLEDRSLGSVTVLPASGLSVDFRLPAGERSQFRLTARATCADGRTGESPVHEIDARRALLTLRELSAFQLPEYRSQLVPLEISAPFGASVTRDEGQVVFFAHAPSRLTYELPPEACCIRGRFGIKDGAYAAHNRTPTDGAEFQVDLIDANGRRTSLHRRWLQPASEPADRGMQSFRCMLPPGEARRIEFLIEPGPAGNAASDWTFWSDLALENCR
ncbi:MAG: glycosyltransferase family 39 protein [Opitutaceae bacterium]|nr:glycosyltransferase family 39 protein [Opitutaceae bacterium]